MSVSDSVVLITSSDPKNSTFGTGFVIHRNAGEQATYLLTCAHVVRDVGGKEMVCAADKAASVVAYGDADGNGVDLAVLRVEGLMELPVLRLQGGAQEGDAFFATGFQVFRPNFLLRPVYGTLGHVVELGVRNLAERTQAWDLAVTDSYYLQPGYSGSPVIRNGTNQVIGIVSSRIGEGQRGVAISIQDLQKVWPTNPIAIDPTPPPAQSSLPDEVWDLLTQQIRNGTCVPFLGPGVCSPPITPASEIARTWAAKYGFPFANAGNLAEVSQFLAVKFRDPKYPKNLLAELYRQLVLAPPNFRDPDEPHRLLADLNLAVYLTTNYDDFMVQALKTRYRDVRRQAYVWNDAMESATPPEFEPTVAAPLVYHLHGYIEYRDNGWTRGTESLVLTEDDYLLFLAKMARNASILPSSLRRPSGLFIGYNLTEWNVRGLFQNLKQVLGTGNVGVFQPPPGSAEEQKNAQEYLNGYYGSMQMYIYWGTVREFAVELRQRIGS